MKTRLVGGFIIALLLSSLALAQGGVEILSHNWAVFLNVSCKKTKTCDLGKIEYLVEDYKVAIGGSYNYGTRMFTVYETKSLKSLEKFAFVQFVKGCIFSSRLVD